MGLLDAIISAADRYEAWYRENRLPNREREGQPNCHFCGKKNYSRGPETYATSRYLPTRVTAMFACLNCGMRYRGIRAPHSSRWTFDEAA